MLAHTGRFCTKQAQRALVSTLSSRPGISMSPSSVVDEQVRESGNPHVLIVSGKNYAVRSSASLAAKGGSSATTLRFR